jgi:hypothetical protein
VEASREFEMKNGELEEPHDMKFEETEVRVGTASCSAKKRVEISLEGDVKIDGSAEDGGDGSARLNSIWAAAWVAGCEHGEGEDYESEQIYGCDFGGWFTIPADLLEKYSTDDAGNLRVMIEKLLGGKLNEMVKQANVTSPLTDPKATERELKEVLKDWLEYVRNEWSLFELTG